MGIKHFFQWYKTKFGKHIKMLGKGKDFTRVNVVIDNLMIDLNGIFHSSTQKIYEYGAHKPKISLLGKKIIKKELDSSEKEVKVFEDICQTIENLLNIVNPVKCLILCVDGPAPLSKQNQQRQRRFRAVAEKSEEEFKSLDSNALTPGTKFMDSLTNYIDWYIRKSILTNPIWKKIEVVFSSEKIPGEGEHKLINYMRSYGNPMDRYCIHGLDADLIMLALGTHLPNFWILREDLYNPRNEFFILNIGETRKDLANLMNWSKKTETRGVQVKSPPSQFFNSKYAINDFIFMCFMVGNDFLPHVPSLEIIEGGIDHMIDIYKRVGEIYGHLTQADSVFPDNIVFQKTSLEVFFGTISQYDQGILENKLLGKDKFFPDLLLENNAKFDPLGTKKFELNMTTYRQDYYNKNFPAQTNIKKLCHQYLEGLQWVLSYYTRGVPDWKWCFNYHYAPFAHEIAEYLSDFKPVPWKPSIPTTPFQQLLSVLPPKSAGLIPIPLSQLLIDSKSKIKKFCPVKFDVDVSGKRKDWEGVVLLPMVPFDIISEEYFKYIHLVSNNDLKRNIPGESLVYNFDIKTTGEYVSKYGNIPNCTIKIEIIEL